MYCRIYSRIPSLVHTGSARAAPASLPMGTLLKLKDNLKLIKVTEVVLT